MSADRPLRISVLINLSSASSDNISSEMTSLLQRYGYAEPQVFAGSSSDMGEMLAALRESQADIMIAYGGDGTCAAVAALAREKSCPFIALPGGTMNLLMNGLYGSTDWQTCLRQALACAAPRSMTAGRVIDKAGREASFLVGCLLGRSTRLNEAREEWRDGKKVDAAKDALTILKSETNPAPLRVSVDDEEPKTYPIELVNVLCPFMSAHALRVDRLDVTLFETVTGGSALSLGLSALLGNLRQSQAVETLAISEFQIEADDPIEALLDGEAQTFDRRITVQLDQNWGQVLAPWPIMSVPNQNQSAS